MTTENLTTGHGSRVFRAILSAIAVLASALLGVFLVTILADFLPFTPDIWARRAAAFLIAAGVIAAGAMIFLRGWAQPLPWWVPALGLGGVWLNEWASGGWGGIADKLIYAGAGVVFVVTAMAIWAVLAERQAERRRKRAKYWE